MKKIDKKSKIIALLLGLNAPVIPIYAADYTIDSSSTIQNNGIILDGDDLLTITKKGAISTSTNSNDAINTTGDNIVLINNGRIETLGSSSNAITGQSNTTITNSGIINTTGSSAKGIVLDDSAVVTNSGIIKTSSSNSDAILTGENSVVNNSGTITTLGSSSEGIRVDKNSSIYNSGTITTASEGILTTGDYVRIINSGTIFTSGSNSDGMDLESYNTVTNTGTITTSDDSSDGIYAKSDNIINHSGKITTSGDGSNGVRFQGNNNSITNNGSIKATGINSYGIGSDDTGSMIINNSGYIEATNTGSYAIFNDDADIIDTTLNLKSGSIILGDIDLGNNGGDTDIVNIYGGSPSASITIQNAEQINLLTSGLRIGNTVTTVDSTSEKANSRGLATLTNSIHNSINQRSFVTTTFIPGTGMPNQEQQPQSWVNTFAGMRKFGATHENTGYDYTQYGVSTGHEWEYQNTKMGITAGVAHSKEESDLLSFENKSNYIFAGVYGVFSIGQVKLSTNLLTGYSDLNKKRYVYDNTNGLETALSDTHNIFLSPSINLWTSYSFGERYEFRPSANLTYNIAYLDSYQESGTTQSNLTVDDRYTRSFSSKIQIAIAEKLDSDKELEIRAGFNARYSNDGTVNARLNGTSFDYAIEGDDSEYIFYTGANFKIAKKDSLVFVADLEIGTADRNEEYVNASLQLKFNF